MSDLDELKFDGNTSVKTADGIIDVQLVRGLTSAIRVNRTVVHRSIVNAARTDLAPFRTLDLLTHFLVAELKGSGTYVKVGRTSAINLLSKEKISIRAKRRVLPLDSTLVLECKELAEKNNR